MGRLAIKRVSYLGEKYRYISPEFKLGLNILEGKNGTGKTTFSDLICYALGIYAYQFDPKDDSQHKVVMSDINNYILLEVWLNSEEFKIKRFIKQNTIFVEDIHGNIEVYPIYRQQNNTIFSDWLLSKLSIPIIEIYQGSKKFKLGISDLFRLVHYDQETPARKIYKEHRNNGNFVADSLYIRKVIFEILNGYQFSEYYSKLGELYRLEREKDSAKSVLKNYEDISLQMGYESSFVNKQLIEKELSEAKLQLEKINTYKDGIKVTTSDSPILLNQVQNLRKELLENENELNKWKSKLRNLNMELRSILTLKENVILEVTQIKKIIVAHEEINLFSPNTCPCCLRNVERKEQHCICGGKLDDMQYERFFYTDNEYHEILKSKIKSVETIESALLACEKEKEDVVNIIAKHETNSERIKKTLLKVEKDIKIYTNDAEINELNDKILLIKNQIQKNEQKLVVADKYNQLEKESTNKTNSFESLKKEVEGLENNIIKKSIVKTIENFNTVYNQLMTEASDDIVKAAITENDYMPIINDGEYKQASSNVPKRFMYFLTLLKLSIANKKMPFPRFLLIDTPENLGIDHENLEKVLKQLISEDENENVNYQVILTTGKEKYPKEFKKYVFDTLEDDDKLLKPVDSENK
ncbi:hypothetical protein [Metabacillus sp. B2-18]|uniref:hypothetical protein n=1 Tax=Metabacillus sp. B2-18 TaxID=2897333 RepID=UPI001E4FC641|nr:hypothetical protein [Metabacillus sp. B2-18]UGB29952.1 hypothetical protein LPC09_19870 [Metabacillus sp. B2-18]